MQLRKSHSRLKADTDFSFFLLDSVTIPFSCCMSFIAKEIPENRVVSYQLANGSVCPKAGVM